MKTYNQIAVVGRFTIVHLGHESLFKAAAKRLNPGGKLTILVGSAGHYPSPKHPLSFFHRAEMLYRMNVPQLAEKNIQLEIKPVYDFLYTPQAWTMQVQRAMQEDCALLGHKKLDGSSDWVDEDFPETDYIEVRNTTNMDATSIRKVIYETDSIDKVRKSLSPKVGKYVEQCIKAGFFNRAKEEYWANRVADGKFASHPYPEALNSLCADAVVECKGYILLGKRGGIVGKDTWALPGGHKDKGEILETTALRELDEETKIKVPPRVLSKSIVSSRVFDNPGRSETIDEKVTQAFHIILDNENTLPKVRANSDFADVKWVRLCDVKNMSQKGQLFADHAEIIHHFTGALM